MIKNFFARSASIAALAALAPVAAVYAQETASELRGAIIDQNGAAVAGATVTITHEPTGSTSTLVTTSNGNFFQTGLRPGGPYSIVVAAPGYAGESVADIRLSPGTSPALRIRLAAEGDDTAVMGVVTVTGSAMSQLDLNSGVGSNYSGRDVANQPSLARDVISTLSRDPLAISGGPNNLSVAGVNPRFNGVTIDGARQQDNFGLQANTFATSRSPINIDIIESVSLVASDYSVTASGFTGGLVNVTTRGGTNEIDGSAFYYFRDQDYFGSKAYGGEGIFNPGEFEEKEYGVTLRGPIIKDRLFFSLSYDKFESARQVDYSGNDLANGIQPGFFEALNQLVLDTYGIDMGGRPQQAAIPEETTRYFARVDGQINNDHRMQVNYQKTEDTGVSGLGPLVFQSAWYDTPTVLETYGIQLFSDWTPSLSTRLRANYVDYERGQNCRAGGGVGTGTGTLDIRLQQSTVAGSPLAGLLTSPANRFITGGCDRFRHANVYEDQRLQLQAQADYTMGDLIFTFGGEYENLELFNVFVESSSGLYQFKSAEQLINRTARVEYRNIPSNDANDGAAAWAYSRWTGFGQVRWQALPDLELSGGLRYELIKTDDQPVLDPSSQAAYGFANTNTTDGLDILMPRFGFRYTPFDRTTLTGGFGLFAGGDPAVWTSNSFQVPAVLAVSNNVPNVDPNSVPQFLRDQVAAGTPLAIDATDPNFRIPSDWKASVRLDQQFDLGLGGVDLGRDWRLSLQAIHTRSKDSFLWREFGQTNGGLTPGVAPDGRPIYANLEVLGISNRTVLTNSSGDESWVYTASIDKAFDNGFELYAAYAHQDVEMISEGQSSRGISSFINQTTVDPNNPEPRTSIFQVEDAFKVGLSYERAFVQDLATRVDLFGSFTSGRPFTYTFNVTANSPLFGRPGNGEFGGGANARNPLYIPNLLGDPNVVYGPNFNLGAFADYVKTNGIQQGKVHEVNSAASTWNQQWDLRIQQDLPGIWGAKQFVGDNRFKLVFDVENFGNLLNNEWGTNNTGVGFGQLPVLTSDLVSRADVEANGVAGARALTGDTARTTCTTQASCVYRYNTLLGPGGLGPVTGTRNNANSVWKARIGIRYEF
jgi:hypothetical protein